MSYLHLHESGEAKGKPRKKKGYMENLAKVYRLADSSHGADRVNGPAGRVSK